MSILKFPSKDATVKERLLGESNRDFHEGIDSLTRHLDTVVDLGIAALSDDEAYELLLGMTLMLQLLDRITTRLRP